MTVLDSLFQFFEAVAVNKMITAQVYAIFLWGVGWGKMGTVSFILGVSSAIK